MVTFGLLLVGAYLLGSVPLAYLIAKRACGIDLRKYGSGNVGLSNISTATSKWLAVPVFIFDIGKGLLFVYVARMLGLPVYQTALIGAAAIVGHAWPVFLGFNAGRGILTSVGVIFALEPRLIAVLLIIAFIGLPFKQLPLGTLVSLVLLPLLAWFSFLPAINWLFTLSIAGERLAVTLSLMTILLITVGRRLTVPKSSVASRVSNGQLMLNRLLFDRDIRDRDAWIHRSPASDANSPAGSKSDKLCRPS